MDDGGASFTIDDDRGEISGTIDTGDGMAVMRSGEKVPIALSSGFTVYPGAKVVSNTVFSQNGTSGSLVILESDASPADMVEFYRKQAGAAGIPIELELDAGNGHMIGGKKADGSSFSFNATQDENGTSAQLSVAGGPAR